MQGILKNLISFFWCLLCFSCGQSSNESNEIMPDANLHISKIAGFVDTVSYHLLCMPIDTVNKLFPLVTDSVFESEGVEWPVKWVTHADGNWTVFESSWSDKNIIWSITTTSSTIKFNSPYQVGDKIEEIQKDGFEFTFHEGDGGEYFYFTNERLKHLGFRVEEKYSNEFYNNVYKKGLYDPMKYLNPKATIIELTLSGGCATPEKIEKE
jgi:hypothetical protein